MTSLIRSLELFGPGFVVLNKTFELFAKGDLRSDFKTDCRSRNALCFSRAYPLFFAGSFRAGDSAGLENPIR